MALQDLLNLSSTKDKKKIGLSQERVEAIIPVARQYIAFWREYPDIFVDFLVRGTRTEVREGELKLFLSTSILAGCYAALVPLCGLSPCVF